MARKKTASAPKPDMIITDLGNGFVRIVAGEGYALLSLRLGRTVSEAVVKPEQTGQFKGVQR